MAQLPIIEYPDPRLSEISAEVESFDQPLCELTNTLFDTLYATSGIGLCAPQCGVLQRVFVMDLSEDASQPQEFVNPTILDSSVPCIVEESCLSIPGVVGNVLRRAEVTVAAYDRNGTPFERTLEGMQAVCVQHELDHLDGKLFIERLSLIKRLRIRGQLQALRKQALRKQALSGTSAPRQNLEAVG